MGIFGLSLPDLDISGDFDTYRPDQPIPADLYGLLPQLQWYGGSACVPTAFTNALAGMAAWYETPEVLVSGTDRHNSLLNTRLALGDALGTTPGGTDSANYLSGIHHYFSDQGVANDFSASWNLNSGSQLNVFSELVAAFAKGPVVFHDAYTGGGGHALTGIGLELNDGNNNMRIDPGEAYALIIDPLNPTKTYSPDAINRAGLTDAEALDLWNNTIQAGPSAQPFLQRVEIYQDFDRTENPGTLTFNYDQTAIVPSATTGQADDGQLQFNTDEIWSTRLLPGSKEGSIYGFVGLQRSALPDNLNNAIQPTDRETVVFNFTDFITNNQVAVELFSYFNESSDFSNDLSFYQVADTQGSVFDPISGARLAPGDAGYLEAVQNLAAWFNKPLGSSQSVDSLSGRISQDAAQMGSFSFAIEALDDTALIAPLVTTSAGDTWTPFAEANRDGLNHFQWTGGLSFQVEDQFGLGDGDFNDFQAVFTPFEINGIA